MFAFFPGPLHWLVNTYVYGSLFSGVLLLIVCLAVIGATVERKS